MGWGEEGRSGNSPQKIRLGPEALVGVSQQKSKDGLWKESFRQRQQHVETQRHLMCKYFLGGLSA